MRGTYHLLTAARIPIKIHWTFGFLILYVIYASYSESQSLDGICYLLTFVFILFTCVILHEYGHALAARRYGIVTRDIIISPIGGLARLEEIPEEPARELFVAIAGPLVNVAIALITGLSIYGLNLSFLPDISSFSEIEGPGQILVLVFWMNIVLFIFNLIPAFPMDGGRILRALLSYFTSRLTATYIAMLIGRLIAIALFIYAINQDQYVLMFVSLFVFMSAGSEYQQLRLVSSLSQTTAGDIVLKNHTILDVNSSIIEAIKTQETSNQSSFIIGNENSEWLGSLPSVFIEQMKEDNRSSDSLSIESYVIRNVSSIGSQMTLKDLFSKMQEEKLFIVRVIDETGNELGIIDRKKMQAAIESMQPAGIFSSFRKNLRNPA